MIHKSVLTLLVLCLVLSLPSWAEETKENENPIYKTLVGFIQKRNPQLTPAIRTKIAETILSYSTKHNLSPTLVASLIAVESNFNPWATSSHGAMGLGQLMPRTAEELGVKKPYDIEQNIAGVTRHLRELYDAWASHPQKDRMVLASYLLGIDYVRPRKTLPPYADRYQSVIWNMHKSLNL